MGTQKLLKTSNQLKIYRFSYSAVLLKTGDSLTLLHSERPKHYGVLVFLSAIGLKEGLAHEQF